MILTSAVLSSRLQADGRRGLKKGSNNDTPPVPAANATTSTTPLHDATSANCSGMGISRIDDISFAVNLSRMNLSNNDLSGDGECLEGLLHCVNLTWLDLSKNRLEEPFRNLVNLGKLQVLNLSHNNMNRISLHASKLTSLKALMLNNNSILRIDNISSIKNLNTIVLSHNSITVIENIFTLPALTKLSLSHNRVRVIPDTLASLSSLRELRLAHNRILSLPSRAMSGLSALEILDLGHNLLTGWESVTALEGCLHLVNLNLLGNGVCGVGEKGAEKGKDEKGEWKKEKGGEEYREKVLGLVPTLRVLDGDRFDPKFLERREKRKGVMERKKRMEENLAKKGKTTPAGDGGASGPGRQDEARERRQRPGADGEEDGDGGEVDRPRKRPKSDNGWVVPSAIGVEESARVRDDAPKPGLKSAKKKKDDELKPTTKPGLKKDVARKSILSRKNPTSSSASTIATSTVTSDFKPLSAPAPPPFKPKPKATSFLSADDTKPQPYSKSQASLLSGEVVPDSTLGKRESSSLLDGDSLEMEKKRQARSGVVAIIEAKQPRRAVTTTTAAKVKVVKTGTPVFAAAGSGAVSVGKWD